MRCVACTFDVPIGRLCVHHGTVGFGQEHAVEPAGCLDRPTGGSLFLGTQDISMMNDDELSRTRATSIGFVFQSYNLIPQLTVVENIEVPLYYQGRLKAEDRQRCLDIGGHGRTRRSVDAPTHPVVWWSATARGDRSQPDE